jgi:hypothetical protein
MITILLSPFRMTAGATKVGYRAGRAVGYRRLFLIGLGVGVGLLVAPVTGREARARLREFIEARRPPRVSDPELGERVRVELRHATRTWHLPQPEVAVEGGRVVLRGSVPHETARHDLEAAAAAVPGVAAVDNHLVVAANGN